MVWQFSSFITRQKKLDISITLKIKTSNQDNLLQYLSESCLKYKQDDGLVTVFATNIEKILDIISVFKESIEDIEINKGTLNDVFIAITGKEIRV